MGDQPVSVRRDFYGETAAIALHPQGDPPELGNGPSSTRRIPAQPDVAAPRLRPGRSPSCKIRVRGERCVFAPRGDGVSSAAVNGITPSSTEHSRTGRQSRSNAAATAFEASRKARARPCPSADVVAARSALDRGPGPAQVATFLRPSRGVSRRSGEPAGSVAADHQRSRGRRRPHPRAPFRRLGSRWRACRTRPRGSVRPGLAR